MSNPANSLIRMLQSANNVPEATSPVPQKLLDLAGEFGGEPSNTQNPQVFYFNFPDVRAMQNFRVACEKVIGRANRNDIKYDPNLSEPYAGLYKDTAKREFA